MTASSEAAKQQHQQKSSRPHVVAQRKPSISDLMRQRSSFGGGFVRNFGSNRPQHHAQLKAFDNLKTSLVPDSPTASATTGSRGGSPYSDAGSVTGSPGGGRGSPAVLGMSPMSYDDGSLSSGGRDSPMTTPVSPCASSVMMPSTALEGASGLLLPTRSPPPPSIPLSPDDEGSPAGYAHAYMSSIPAKGGPPSDAAANSPAELSIVSTDDSASSSKRIDHMALLLGFDGGEESGDDEREWNGCFSPEASLDELDGGRGGEVRCRHDVHEKEQQHRESSHDGVVSGKKLEATDGPEDDSSEVDDDSSSVNVNVGYESPGCESFGKCEEGNDGSNDGDDGSCVDEGLQLDMGLATLEDMPRTYSHDDFLCEAICSDLTSNDEFHDQEDGTEAQDVQETTSRETSSFKTAQQDTKHPSDESLSTWDKGSRSNKFDIKKKAAATRALAMKERASSALAAKAREARERVKGASMKDTLRMSGHSMLSKRSRNRKQEGGKRQQDMHQERPSRGRDERPNGMEITMGTSNDITDALSQVSSRSFDIIDAKAQHFRSKIVPQVSLAPKEFPRYYERASVRSSAAASQASARSRRHAARSAASAMSAVTSMKEKASSAISQKAHRARERTAGLSHIGNNAGVSSLQGMSSVFVRQGSQRRNGGAVRTRQRLALPPGARDEIESLLSIDEDSDVPSVMNSEGPSSVREWIASPGAANSGSMFVTPKARTRKGGGRGVGGPPTDLHQDMLGLQVIGNIHLDDTVLRGNLSRDSLLDTENTCSSIASSSQLPTPEIRACPSTVSHGSTGAISCIDGDGFLISPTTSIDRTLDTSGPAGAANAAAAVGHACCISTVGSTDRSESTFDPNSFLFLSPLSNADMDDPDYGMPDLLSRSNSHNAANMSDDDDDDDHPPRPPTGGNGGYNLSPIKYNKKLMPRLPPSPRLLPPSGKKMMRKMTKGGGYGYGYGAGGAKPDGNSQLRVRTSMF
eukprot:CAMPEP_0181107316 /NCGR_PEP_ID=MMETSP1071-20121207/17023_1 /TAXON_ID=35127 /ORGANISM="Thalassiosira sp., Strain NH16" /LENGTH=975 /DNA_ID=CAMNT_0023190827 /DNA_START=107 /DNA_END=3034 /DNA_ORIENTATION=+